jgi:hypothetical protein
MKKVRLHVAYTFQPAGWDLFMPEHYSATPGQRVRVVQLPSAPRPNTMGHAHIPDATTGEFLGLVSTASLLK